MKSFGLIYKVTNKINGKIYIGQTTLGLEIRRRNHINDANANRYNSIFHRGIRKYNIENFTWQVLEYCDSKEEMNEMEFHYIMQYGSLNSGYNLTINTSCQAGKLNPNYGNTMSEKTKNRLSKLAKDRYASGENHPWIGRKHKKESMEKMKNAHVRRAPISEETRKKMSESQKRRDPSTMRFPEYKRGKDHHSYGKHISDAHKKLLSEAFSGKNNPFYGKKHSVASRKLISKNHADFSGKNHPMYGKTGSNCPNSKKYVVITPKNYSFVVHGLYNFCRNYTEERLYDSSLNSCANGRSKHHKGYKCRYYNEDVDSDLPMWEM